MNKQEYEQKKRECLDEFCKLHDCETPHDHIAETFNYAFDRAYALGKQIDTITQEEIRSAGVEYSEREHYGCLEDGEYTHSGRDVLNAAESGFIDGADFALSRQWISVEERLPEYNATCLVFGHQDFGDGYITRYTMMAHYDGENFYDAYNDRKYHPEMWMAIPTIPQLNPEKQSI